jgi:hypothetical protein
VDAEVGIGPDGDSFAVEVSLAAIVSVRCALVSTNPSYGTD